MPSTGLSPAESIANALVFGRVTASSEGSVRQQGEEALDLIEEFAQLPGRSQTCTRTLRI
ncbi:hypothetical protein MesoLj131a_40160 [Mesorhizobium sp. 131-2-1]|nr:hypothetical protein MesoLj131a_40160 [Mesorhizobium sp. 131-2-1]